MANTRTKQELRVDITQHIETLWGLRKTSVDLKKPTPPKVRAKVRDYDREIEYATIPLLQELRSYLEKEEKSETGFDKSLKSMRQSMATAMNTTEDNLPGFEAIVYSLCAETRSLRDQRDRLLKSETSWATERQALREKLERIMDERKQKLSLSELIDMLELDLNCEHERALLAENASSHSSVGASGGGGRDITPYTLNSVFRHDGLYIGECGAAQFCEHANEVPLVCPCTNPLCYCKAHTCKPMLARITRIDYAETQEESDTHQARIRNHGK